MIRFINAVRLRREISTEQFRQFWNGPEIDALIREIATYAGAAGYSKSLTLIVAANDVLRLRRAYGQPFDGVLEYWWNDAVALQRALNSKQCIAFMDAMVELQRPYVDLERSCAFFTESSCNPLVAGAAGE